MKMRDARVIVTLAVHVKIPEDATLDIEAVADSVERRVRVLRAHTSAKDGLFIKGELNPNYFEVDRVYVVEPRPREEEKP